MSESRLWELVLGGQAIDPEDLSEALEEERASGRAADSRTRLLIEECEEVLRPRGRRSLAFPSLSWRVVKVTRPETIEQFLRDIGLLVKVRTDLVIGGSSALILQGLLSRSTEDVDIVDEVPEPLRQLRGRMEAAERRYSLHLAHFQSHYLPEGWAARLISLGDRGRLSVSLVDPVDLFVGKLFSRRDKDRDDLRHLAARLDRETVVRRLVEHGGSLRSDPKLLAAAVDNWYVLFGEGLPG